MKCEKCGNEFAATVRYGVVAGKTEVKGCESCGGVPRIGGVPDVYFKAPYFDPNLGDEANPNGRMVESKEHKQAIMREQGLVEKGDRVRGARI